MSQKTILSILSDFRDNYGKPYDAEKIRQYAKRFQEREITYEGLQKFMRTSDGTCRVWNKLKQAEGMPAGVYLSIANAVADDHQQKSKKS